MSEHTRDGSSVVERRSVAPKTQVRLLPVLLHKLKNAVVLALALSAVAAIAVPWLLFEHVLDGVLAVCEPHDEYGTRVWHRHYLLWFRYIAVHDADGFRMYSR